MDENKFKIFVKDGYSNPISRPFYEKLDEWIYRNSYVWQELKLIIQKAEVGDFNNSEICLGCNRKYKIVKFEAKK